MSIEAMIDNKNKTDELKSSAIMTSIITSLITVILSLTIFLLGFQPIEAINQNKKSIQDSEKQISSIKKSIEISRKALELQVRDYITKNYGELSERDEKVDKLLIYFKQQDARLNNIEKALSKF